VNIKEFLALVAEARSFETKLVSEKRFVFAGSGTYPWRFFSGMLPRLAVQLGFASVSRIDPEDVGTVLSIVDVERRLHVSFLGLRDFFWFGDIARFGKALERDLLALLANYQGPHTVGYYVDISPKSGKKDSAVGFYVDCSEPLSYDDFSLLARIFYPATEGVEVMEGMDLVTIPSAGISLETASLFLTYLAVGGRVGKEAISVWSERLVVPEHSLFKLAQFLFSKDRMRCLELWHAVRAEYPPEFWIAFWSEQLWQAHHFIAIALQGDLVLAKKGVNRLPFSFMQRDWRNYRLRELAAAHSILYGVDGALKNGGGSAGLDLFILRFLTGSFARA